MRRKIILVENLTPRDGSFFGRDDLKKDLRRRSVQGGLIRAVSNGTSALLAMGSTIILARLITPSEFGLVAMVFAVTDFARLFIELGLGTVTVQREEITHEEVSALFWINLGVGIFSMAVTAGLSQTVAWFYGEPRLSSICVALSTVFVFRGLTVQHRSLLERQMRFGYLGIIYVGSTFLSVCIAIALALQGFGVWALVWRELVSAALYASGTWVFCGWIPSHPRRNSVARSSLRFGADLLGVSVAEYFTKNLDRVLIGRFCGAAPLGLYSKAQQMVQPIEHIQMTILGVGLSPLGALQSEAERYRRFYSRLLSALSFLYMPLVMLLVIQAGDVIRLLLGERWVGAAPLLRILAIAMFVRPILNTCQLVMISCGKTGRYFRWGMVNSICLIVAFAFGIRWESLGVAYAYAFANYLLLIWSLWYCFKETPVSGLLLLKTVSLPLISSLGAGVFLVSLLPTISNTSTLVTIIISTIVIIGIYFAIWLCLPNGRKKLSEFLSYRAELFRRG